MADQHKVNTELSPYNGMSNEEIIELGRSTLYGALPHHTVVRLFFGACRLMDDNRKLVESNRKLAEEAVLLKQGVAAPTVKQEQQLEAMARALETLRNEALNWQDLYEKTSEDLGSAIAQIRAYKQEIELLGARIEHLKND